MPDSAKYVKGQTFSPTFAAEIINHLQGKLQAD
jgi:hypothetical protein